MNKKFLLALAGVVLSLGSASAVQAQEVTAGVDVGYRQTTIRLEEQTGSTKDIDKYKGIKHLLVKAHADALFDNQIWLGSELRYGFAMGKMKPEVNGVKDKKIKNKISVFEGDVAVGYRIGATDALSLTPFVGYEFQKYKKKGDIRFKNIHSPIVGLQLNMNPSDEFTMSAKVQYGWPKVQEVDYKQKGKAKNLKAQISFGYAVDETCMIDLDLGYNHLKMKKAKIANTTYKGKVSSWEATVGVTTLF